MKTGCNVDLEFGPEIGQTGNSVACGDGNGWKQISQFYLFPNFTQQPNQPYNNISRVQKKGNQTSYHDLAELFLLPFS